MSHLEVTDLVVSFGRHRKVAVDGVSFTLDRGRTLGVVGESGSGKTVLSRSIMGLLTARNVVREGSVVYDGKELIGRKPAELRAIWGNEMAMVFQDPMTSLNPVLTVETQIAEAITSHGLMSKQAARARAVELLDLVGIPDPHKRVKQYPHQFSGGMRQRAMIAIGVACEPKLLIADEATTALDVTVQGQILDLMKDLNVDCH